MPGTALTPMPFHGIINPVTRVSMALLCLALVSSGTAAPLAPPVEEVRRAAEDLGSSDSGTRENAFRWFLDWGVAAPEEALRSLPDGGEDPDLRALIERLRAWIPAEKARREFLDLASPDDSFRERAREIWETPQSGLLFPFFVDLGRQDGGFQKPEAKERRRKIVRCLMRHPAIDFSFKSTLAMTISSDDTLPLDDQEIRLFLDLLETTDHTARITVFHSLHRLLDRRENLPGLRASPLAERLAAIVARPLAEYAPGSDLRGEAASLLLTLSGPSAVPQVVGLLDHPQAMVRVRVVHALGGLKLKNLEPAFRKLMADKDAICRNAAAIALARLGPVDPVEVEAEIRALIQKKAMAAGAPPAYMARLTTENDAVHFACTTFRRDPELEEEIARAAKGFKVIYETPPQPPAAEIDADPETEGLEDPGE